MEKYNKYTILDTIYCIEQQIALMESTPGTPATKLVYRYLIPVGHKNYSVDLVSRIWGEIAGEAKEKCPTAEQLKVLVKILRNYADETK